MALRAHSWSWMLDHSTSKDVDALRNGGYDTIKVMPYFYMSVRHEQTDNSIRYVKTPAKKEGKIIAINRGSNIRVMPYSKEACEYMGIAG